MELADGSKINMPKLREAATCPKGEKGVEPPDMPVVSGGPQTHRVSSSSDDRSCLAGSINNILTHLSFTTDYMTDFAKSADDYTLHFQAAFLHGMNILALMVLSGMLRSGTYYLVMNCMDCQSLRLGVACRL